MKKYLLIAFRLTLVCIVLFSVIYPLSIWAVAQLTPTHGAEEIIRADSRVVAYTLLAQSVTRDEYFQPRPSAVAYNAAGSGGSNKGPSNMEYRATQRALLDSFLVHNPEVHKEQVPAELLCASASGLDPDLSPQAAYVQIPRVAMRGGISQEELRRMVDETTSQPIFGVFGVPCVNINLLNAKLLARYNDSLHLR